MGLMGRCGCDIWRLGDLFSFFIFETWSIGVLGFVFCVF